MSADDHEPTTLGAAVRRALEAHAKKLGITIEELREEAQKDDEALQRHADLMRSWGFEVKSRFDAAIALERLAKNKEAGRRGGARSKRKEWAEWAAEQVTNADDLPGPDKPLEYGMADIYRDGDRLCLDGAGAGDSIAISTFERWYLRKTK